MKYVILTYQMAGLSGAPSYVNNKVKWLNERGIDTVVFDHYGGLNVKRDIVLENLLPFKQNRMLELFFPPSYFTRRQRNHILDRLYNTIGEADECVVESNSTRLALWGELLAERLRAKHLVLLVGEHVEIRSKEEFCFLDFKLDRHELFTIKAQTIQKMFKGYRVISDDEAKEMFFAASMGVMPEDVPMQELKELPSADYNILSFGRYKPYFENMIEGVVNFSNNHKEERINFLIMGNVELPQKIAKRFGSVSNLFVTFIPSKRPVPKAIFDYSDVVIATAGCANLSYKTGAITVSMDVNTCLPLGVMGFTTIDSVYSSDENQPLYDVCNLLEEILVDHIYDGEQRLIKKGSGKGFDFQWKLINDDRQYWSKVDRIVNGQPLLRLCEILILRCGGIRLFTQSRFSHLFKS